MPERRVQPTRRRRSHSGRRSTDPRPGDPLTVIDAIVSRVEAVEQRLLTQFQRIAQLQLDLDRLAAKAQTPGTQVRRKSKRA